MIVTVPATGPARLDEQGDFKALKVAADPGAPDARVLDALGATAADEPGHVWIPAARLRGLAAPADGWEEAFAAMLAKVEPYGWYDRTRDAVKAHVERG